MEALTDNEKRIFLAAMGREEELCREKGHLILLYECKEIVRKVKGALWQTGKSENI